MTTPTPPFTKPEGLILVKGDRAQGQGTEIFGIWPSGFVRQITAAEWLLWGSPKPDRNIAFGDDAEFLQLHAYDKALRG